MRIHRIDPPHPPIPPSLLPAPPRPDRNRLIIWTCLALAVLDIILAALGVESR